MKEQKDIIQSVTKADKGLLERIETRSPIIEDQYRMYRGADNAEEPIRLREYWRAIRKRLWLVVGIALLMTTITAVYMARRPDIFQAKARVQVDPEVANPDLVGNDRPMTMNSLDSSAHFNTQLQVLSSSSLLRRVIKELNLESTPEKVLGKSGENKSTLQSILITLGLASKAKPQETSGAVPVATSPAMASNEDLAEAKRLSEYVEAIQKKLKVEPWRENRATVKETRLIDIYYEHTDPNFAALLVNKIAELFTRSNNERRNKTSRTTNDFLKERVAAIQAEIKRDSEDFQRRTANAGILRIDENSTIVLERLQGLNKQLLDSEEKRKNAEAQYNAAKRSPEALQSLAEDNTNARNYINLQKARIEEAKKDRERLLVENTEEWYEVKEKEREIAALTKDLEDYRERAKRSMEENLRTSYLQAQEQERKVKSDYSAQYNQALAQNGSEIGIKLLQQEIENKKVILENLYKQQRENDVVAAGTENNVNVVDAAVPPDEPIAPRRLTMVILSFLASLMFGCGLALFLEFLDDTIRTTEDVENTLRLPAIGVIPSIDSVPRRKLLVAGKNNDENESTIGRGEVLITNDKRSSLAEAYRSLRTSVLLSTAGHAPKSLLITSSVPSEGKTTNAVNTAISLAQTGAKVLIIDADMRRPRLHNIFQVTNGEGLSTILSSDYDEAETLDIIQHEETTGLYILPSGPVPPNPAELIGSEQMIKLMRLLEKNFTHVVVDSPPIASFTDGVLIASMVDGVLLVVHAGKSSRQVVKRSKQLLQDVGAKVFGIVLNNVDLKSQDNHYYYQSHYYQSLYDNADQD